VYYTNVQPARLRVTCVIQSWAKLARRNGGSANDGTLRRPGFGIVPGRVGFVVDKVGQDCLRVLQFSPINAVPPILHTLN
jgi:hypothetical protein